MLHATADLRVSLNHVRRLLAPGGLLILVEGVRPRRWIDVTFGLTDGWWKFTDLALRPRHPLLGAAGWQDLLGDMGFQDPRVISEAGSDGPLAAQAVVLAKQRPELHGRAAPSDLAAVRRPWRHRRTDRCGAGFARPFVSARRAGHGWARLDRRTFTLDPSSPDDYSRLLREWPLRPGRVVPACSICGHSTHLHSRA